MYINVVASWAAILPIGIDLEGLARSPDRLAPAIIPVTDGK